MELLDISQSHEDSPDFREKLANLEVVIDDLEKKLRHLVNLCVERQQAASKEQQLTQELVVQFDKLGSGSVLETAASSTVSSVEVITTALKQLIDNQERMFEQINIGIVKPLQHFLSRELESLRASRKSYRKARSEAVASAERFGQCKKSENTVLIEISGSLFEARCELHRAACNYAMDLNLLQAKRLPDFLQRVVDFMTTQLSYFHLGHVTVKDTESHITTLYTTLEGLRSEATSKDTQQRSEARQLLERVASTRAQALYHLQIQDLHIPPDQAKSNVNRLLTKISSDVVPEDLTTEQSPISTQSLSKHGYMCYAEPKTFGTSWRRLYFSVDNGQLTSRESVLKVPVLLNLNLCTVKPAETVDTERSFCFKVISPQRTVLLQAEGSRELQEWMTVLNNAIGAALLSHKDATPPPTLTPGQSTPQPVRPPRPRKKASLLKEIYSIPGNEQCADCHASSPKWASVNLGVVVCIECSGVHRSLGVYVSQARSLTLDTLKSEWVQRLKLVGNTHSNDVYEALLPVDFDPSLRRGEGRRVFITDKYTHMLYTTDKDKARISQEREAAHAESLRKTGALISASDDTVEDGWVKVPDNQPTDESHDILTESHDVPTESQDLPTESCDMTTQSEDLPRVT